MHLKDTQRKPDRHRKDWRNKVSGSDVVSFFEDTMEHSPENCTVDHV